MINQIELFKDRISVMSKADLEETRAELRSKTFLAIDDGHESLAKCFLDCMKILNELLIKKGSFPETFDGLIDSYYSLAESRKAKSHA